MNRALSIVISIAMLIGIFGVLPVSATEEMVNSGINYTESTETVKNPHMGYPAHGTMFWSVSGNTARNDSGFMWYYINLSRFSGANSLLPDDVVWPEDRVDREISEDALSAFRTTLENLRQNGGSCFIRFVYDWDGQAGREPSSIETILTHIRQLCAVVSDYEDICLGFECGIIGVFGEMHTSMYCESQYANRIMDAYLDNTPDSMILMVRTPSYITQYLGITRSELAELVTEKGSPEYRLSYFNDGYMNSDNDLGTWSNRAEDLKFLYSQSEHATYGGEYGSAYWILPCDSCLPENAIPEMYKTHVNFIRGNVYSTGQNEYFGYDSYTYSEEYEEDWYPDNSAFYGVDCHQFIVSHLGYRLVVRESLLSKDPVAGGTLTVSGKIENTGFANVLHDPTTQMLLVRDGYTYVCDVAIDAADFKSCTVTDYVADLHLPAGMPAGEYKVYMRMSSSTETDYLAVQSSIRFANEGGIYDSSYGANYMGTVNVREGAASSVSNANDVFCEVGENAVSGGRVTEGAPIIGGVGMPTGGTLTLNYHIGDTLTLSAWNMLRSDSAAVYVWYKGDSVISNEAVLAVEDLTADDVGEYKLEVSIADEVTTTMTVNVNVDEHTFGEYVLSTEASCHATGSESRSCSHCELTEERVIPATAHMKGEVLTMSSTCTVRGNNSAYCLMCGDLLEYKILDLIPHDFETVTVAPSCTEGGSIVDTCVSCGYESTEIVSAIGHDYAYSFLDNTASGICRVCNHATESKTFDGYSGYGVESDSFNGDLSGAVPVDSTPLILIGDGGYMSEYQSNSASYITIVFRMSGVEEPIKLGKFRTTAYAYGDTNNLGDSNNAGNYYGSLLYTIDTDGVYALTIRKYLMLPYGNGGWGNVTWAAFNDPESTKGDDTVNANENATFELLGVYDGYIDYHVLFVDEEGGFLESHEGTYNPDVTWSNKMCKTVSAEELFAGDLPSKPTTAEYVYTFSHWESAEGERYEYVKGNIILHPVFTAVENICTHENLAYEYITEPTCIEDGYAKVSCDDCGLYFGESAVSAIGHSFSEEGFCSSCGEKKVNVRGDANGDGNVNIIDMICCAQYIAQGALEGAFDLSNCDVIAMNINGDDVIDQFDLNVMAAFIRND